MTDQIRTLADASFRKYDHLERVAHPDVHDIAFGVVHVFPKIDGTNASVWSRDGVVCCGSRNRELTADADNAGFHAWVTSDDVRAIALRTFVLQFPNLIVYGEWLVPHTLKTYREDAWRRFYVFDVFDRTQGRYVSYDVYAEPMAQMGMDVILPLAVIENPSENQLAGLRDTTNTYLIRDDAGVGEGIVLKNYDWANKYGRQPWAKMVRNEFKEGNKAAFGIAVTKGEKQVEAEMVAELATPDFICKTWAKVVHLCAHEAVEAQHPTAELLTTDENGNDVYDAFVAANRGKLIPRFLGTLFHEFVVEETWTAVKRWKNPVVDFSKLNKLLTIAAKRTMQDVF